MRAFAATLIALGLLGFFGCIASDNSVAIPAIMILIGIAAFIYNNKSDDDAIERYEKND